MEIFVNLYIIIHQIYANHKGDIFLRDLPYLNLIRSLSVSPETPVL